jgi:hypothetical protein
MAKRGRKTKDESSNSLLDALRFISLCQREIGSVTQTHCRMHAGWVAATDGVLTLGSPIDDDLDTCPHTVRLMQALERSSEGVALTQLDSTRLSVRSAGLRAVIPCVPAELVPITWADPQAAVINDQFSVACKAIEHVASDTGNSAELISFLVTGQTISATNRSVVVEYRHGNDLPPYFVLPKSAVTAICKTNKTLSGFGYNGNSATFYFTDNCWLKTQLFEDKWPNINKVFGKEKENSINIIPLEIFKALNLIGDFSDTGQVRFQADLLKTVNTTGDGAEHDISGLVPGPVFAIKNLQMIQSLVKELKINPKAAPAFFYGENLRGAIVFHSE